MTAHNVPRLQRSLQPTTLREEPLVAAPTLGASLSSPPDAAVSLPLAETPREGPQGLESNQQLPESLVTLGNGPSASHYAAPFLMSPSCSADPGSGTMAYDAPRGAAGGGETQSTPRQSQMFQQNLTHIHGDVIAQQNNIDVEMMQQNAINLAEIRNETAINEMQHTVVNVAETRHENVVNNLKQEATIHYENKVLEVVTEASSHVEAANTRAADAERQRRVAAEAERRAAEREGVDGGGRAKRHVVAH